MLCPAVAGWLLSVNVDTEVDQRRGSGSSLTIDVSRICWSAHVLRTVNGRSRRTPSYQHLRHPADVIDDVPVSLLSAPPPLPRLWLAADGANGEFTLNYLGLGCRRDVWLHGRPSEHVGAGIILVNMALRGQPEVNSHRERVILPLFRHRIVHTALCV